MTWTPHSRPSRGAALVATGVVAVAAVLLLPARTGRAHQVEVEISCPVPESEPVSLFVTGHTGPTCALSSPADADAFQFFTFAGTRMRVMAAAEVDHLDPRLVVLDPTLALLDDSSCDGGSVAAPLPRCAAVYEFVAAADGTYRVEVSDDGADESGAYTLQLEALPGSVDELINQPVFNDFNTLEIPTDLDHHRIQAQPGQTIEIEMISCGANMDPRIEAWDPAGAKRLDVHCSTPPGPPPPIAGPPVECADDFPLDPDLCTAFGAFEVTVEGIQHISLSDEGSNGRGRYDFTITRVPEPAPAGLAAAALLATGALARARLRRKRTASGAWPAAR